MTQQGQRYFGKFRGIVTDNKDPFNRGRIRAKVTDIDNGDELGWAEPCFPFTGSDMGFFALPDVDAHVWIEFEHGDTDYPVWVGGRVAAATDLPSVLLTPPYQKLIIQSKGGSKILIDDTPGIGGITLETSGGQKVVLSATGVEITNGQGATIKMTGPTISINNGALEVS